MVNERWLEKIPADGPFYLFQGCFINHNYPGIEAATRFVLDKLGVKYFVSEDQSCCGLPEFGTLANPLILTCLVGRNLDVMRGYASYVMTACNGCYSAFHTSVTLMKDPEVARKTEEVLGKLGRKYSPLRVVHFADFVYKRLEDIVVKSVKVLGGLKMAVHYGCHYFVFEEEGLDSRENPSFVEEVIMRLGGEPVNYMAKDECCGFGMIQQVVHKNMAYAITEEKINSILDAGAEAILVICPYCLNVLDRNQRVLRDIELIEKAIPVIHISQLVALVLGASLEKMGFELHSVDVKPFIERIKERKMEFKGWTSREVTASLE
ncbi:MAG: heterodisulfide reductase-related iron-sulfur binding cluster [Candidatus Jordarchaeales archaeon]